MCFIVTQCTYAMPWTVFIGRICRKDANLLDAETISIFVLDKLAKLNFTLVEELSTVFKNPQYIKNTKDYFNIKIDKT